MRSDDFCVCAGLFIIWSVGNISHDRIIISLYIWIQMYIVHLLFVPVLRQEGVRMCERAANVGQFVLTERVYE